MAVEKTTCPWSESVEDVLATMDANAESGISGDSVADRRRHCGANHIARKKSAGPLRILIDQFRSVVVLILCLAAVLAFATGKTTEAVAIMAVVLVNCGIGFVSEWQASKSMDALRRMGRRKVRVRRDGREFEVDARALVCGDICLHEGGDMASADLRLIEANKLQVDESGLTGESEPVAKTTDPLPQETPLAERSNMLYRGTTTTNGSAIGVVVAVGTATELGRIAELAQTEEQDRRTPLERRLNQLGHRLAWVALGVCAAVGAIGLFAGRSVVLMVETSIALGVAAVPEGLPFVATIGLARGMWLMARKQALVKRLPAVETLGAANLILTDKTGTLTENRMHVAKVVTANGVYDLDWSDDSPEEELPQSDGLDKLVARALEIGVLCNNATLSSGGSDSGDADGEGDPTEIALLQAGARVGINRQNLLEEKPEKREIAFDSETMMMATVHANAANGFEVAVKGAPNAVLDVCRQVLTRADGESEELDTKGREKWERQAKNLARQGLRTLAMAVKHQNSIDEEPYEGLTLVGLAGMLDPPREEVRDVLSACGQAGIRVVMVTGDQPETAKAIAQRLYLNGEEDHERLHGSDLQNLDNADGKRRERILGTDIFARVNPEQKLNLLRIFQEDGNTVAMTGDGVNDAPALSQADIGVVMGRRSTDAARESGDIILKDDRFRTILTAIEQGRAIFVNIRRAVVFMLCTNLAEVMAVGLASAINAPLPLRPLQILFLNVITDVFPAMALAVGKAQPDRLMGTPPRPPGEPILRRTDWLVLTGWSCLLAACVMSALMVAVHAFGMPTGQAVTVSFLALAFAKLWFVFNLSDRESPIIRNEITQNPWLWGALALCTGLLLIAVYLPPLAAVLETVRPGPAGWAVAMTASLVPLVVGQAGRLILGRWRPDRA